MGKTFTNCRKCCYDCNVACDCFEIIVSGVQDDNCSLCGEVNGTFNLQRAGSSNCQWGGREPVSSGTDICVSGLPEGGWRFGYNFDADAWRLTNPLLGSGVFYQVAFSGINCNSTVESVNCTTCDDTISSFWELIVTGVTDNQCSDCNKHNRTSLLEYLGSSDCRFNGPSYFGPSRIASTCNDRDHAWDLFLPPANSSPQLRLGRGFGFDLILELASGVTFDCSGTNVFNTIVAGPNDACSWPTSLSITSKARPNNNLLLIGVPSDNCQNWPSEINVSNVTCITEITDCSDCVEGMSECWELVVAGVSTGTCSNCNEYNGIFILQNQPLNLPLHDACTFFYPEFSAASTPGCADTNVKWFMQRIVGTWYLIAGEFVSIATSLNIAVYTISAFDCNGPNIFNLLIQNGNCSGFPATLTVEPIGC